MKKLQDCLNKKTNQYEFDSYEPDYDSQCMNCGHSPVVTAVSEGDVVYSTEMCGACTWGEAKCLDPSEW